MKKVVLVISGVLIVLIVGATIFLYITGFFAKVVVREEKVGPYVLVYEEHLGDYKNIPSVINKVSDMLLNNEKIQTTKTFGIYYDDPSQIATDELRSIGGVVLEGKNYDRRRELSKKYNVKEIEEQNALIADFPFNNQYSIIAGIIRVYPKIAQYAKEKNYFQREMMEIYDMPNKKITYIIFLDQ